MKNFIKIITLIAFLFLVNACNPTEINFEPLIELNSPEAFIEPNLPTINKSATSYKKQIISAFKYNSAEVTKYSSGWEPYPVFNKPVTWEIKFSAEKAREVTASVKSSICSKAEIEVLFAQVCVEAAATLKASLSQATIVTRLEKLKAYEQVRYKVLVGYDYFQGTLVVQEENTYGPGNIAPLRYTVYWKIPKYTTSTTEIRKTK